MSHLKASQTSANYQVENQDKMIPALKRRCDTFSLKLADIFYMYQNMCLLYFNFVFACMLNASNIKHQIKNQF